MSEALSIQDTAPPPGTILMVKAVESYEDFREMTDTSAATDTFPRLVAHFPYNHSDGESEGSKSYQKAAAAAHISFLGLVSSLTGVQQIDRPVPLKRTLSSPFGSGRAIVQRGTHVLVENMLLSGEAATPHGYTYTVYPASILVQPLPEDSPLTQAVNEMAYAI
jgi:hypothetical protein